jgi:hypothetical protein
VKRVARRPSGGRCKTGRRRPGEEGAARGSRRDVRGSITAAQSRGPAPNGRPRRSRDKPQERASRSGHRFSTESAIGCRSGCRKRRYRCLGPRARDRRAREDDARPSRDLKAPAARRAGAPLADDAPPCRAPRAASSVRSGDRDASGAGVARPLPRSHFGRGGVSGSSRERPMRARGTAPWSQARPARDRCGGAVHAPGPSHPPTRSGSRDWPCRRSCEELNRGVARHPAPSRMRRCRYSVFILCHEA